MSHEKLEKSVKMILSPGKVSVLRNSSFVKKKKQKTGKVTRFGSGGVTEKFLLRVQSF